MVLNRGVGDDSLRGNAMSWEEGISIATRQRCGVCHHVAPVSFFVPHELWRVAVPDYFRDTPMCLTCFASFADERLLAWDREIQFYPMSLRTQLDARVEKETK